MKRRLYKFIFFRLMGWSITGHFNPDIKKCVIMVMPHTSWRDFYIGLLARGVIGIQMNFVAKKELFSFPFGAYFSWMGGAPIDRSGNQNKVEAIAEIFSKHDVFRMAIAPEGTRDKVSNIKTGFYFIALSAGVPIIPVAFDYGKLNIKIGKYYIPSGDLQHDLKILLSHFTEVRGKFPEKDFKIEEFLKT